MDEWENLDPELRKALLRCAPESALERMPRLAAGDAPESDASVIWVYGPIVDGGTAAWLRFFDEPCICASEFAAALDKAGSEVELRVNSPGGYVTEASAIQAEMIRKQRDGMTIRATVDGLAASAASVIVVQCSDVEIAPLGQIMIHQARAIVYGAAKDMRTTADMLERTTKAAAKVYAKRMDESEDEVLKMLLEDGDIWYSADEAVAAKLADRLMEPPAEDGAEAQLKFLQELAELQHLL